MARQGARLASRRGRVRPISAERSARMVACPTTQRSDWSARICAREKRANGSPAMINARRTGVSVDCDPLHLAPMVADPLIPGYTLSSTNTVASGLRDCRARSPAHRPTRHGCQRPRARHPLGASCEGPGPGDGNWPRQTPEPATMDPVGGALRCTTCSARRKGSSPNSICSLSSAAMARPGWWTLSRCT